MIENGKRKVVMPKKMFGCANESFRNAPLKRKSRSKK